MLIRHREIIDESDVFIDVHKAIRRMAPAPRTRVPKGEIVADRSLVDENDLNKAVDRSESSQGGHRKFSAPELSGNPKLSSFLLHRRSSGNIRGLHGAVPSDDEIKQHLKHLGPSNAANRPKTTRISTVKIKPGTLLEDGASPNTAVVIGSPTHAGGVGEGLLANAGPDASDGVHSLSVGYGTMTAAQDGDLSPKSKHSKAKSVDEDARSTKSDDDADENTKLLVDVETTSRPRRRPSVSTLGSLHSRGSRSPSPPRKRNTARSGSISENIVDVNGVKKIVLETTSSSDSEGKADDGPANGVQVEIREGHQSSEHEHKSGGSKKKRKKRGKKKRSGGGEGSESKPLLE